MIDVWSPRETRDIYECVEWAGTQPWSNGKVGLNGISYYAMNAWQVAGVRPKHLAAVCIWEGDGVIDLVVDSDRSEPATFELHTNRGFQYFAEYDGFTITLIALKPDPLTYVLPSPEDYVAMLFVTSSFVPTETTSWSAMKARF